MAFNSASRGPRGSLFSTVAFSCSSGGPTTRGILDHTSGVPYSRTPPWK